MSIRVFYELSRPCPPSVTRQPTGARGAAEHTIPRVPEAAFFVPRGDVFAPTELTRGPWDPDSQHAGPPAGLIAREIERLEGGGGRLVGRIAFEIMRAVPIAPLRVEARVVRPGRSVELVEARLSDSDGPVVSATAWRLRSAEV